LIFAEAPQSTADVASHYDELDRFYREIWGEHVHHGYWATGRESAAQAAEALVELVETRLQLSPSLKLCDIGCGYGATAQHIAERNDLQITGLTVSAIQAERARERRPSRGQISFLEQDWLANGLPDASFDRVFAIESSEHMADKQGFFDEAFRVLKPGGLLAVCAWLGREGARPWEVHHLLEPICREGRMPSMGSATEYSGLAQKAGFSLLTFEDLSKRVRRTWSICARRVVGRLMTRPADRRFLLDPAQRNRVFAVTLLRMLIAYQTGSLVYGLFVFRKPPIEGHQGSPRNPAGLGPRRDVRF
jgi:tocopherol O-methyltransferase